MDSNAAPTANALPQRLRGHVPVLDGIRGIAILLVFGLHAGGGLHVAPGTFDWWAVKALHAGWIGVDLFFVLSGYLITGILCDARESQGYFKNFYARRALRIFPLYYAFLTVVWIAYKARGEEYPFLINAGWYYAYFQNNLLQTEGRLVFGITWSLAVEEQFYLFWPLLVRKLNPRVMLRVCAGIVLLSPVARALLYWLVDESWVFHSYMVTPTRLDGLATGALIALTVRESGGLERLAKWRHAAMAVGFAGTLACFALAGNTGPRVFPTGLFSFSFIALMFGGVLVAALSAPRESALARVLSGRFLGVWGKYSYAVYLLHIPAILLVERRIFGFWWKDRTLPEVFGSQIPVLATQLVAVGAVSLLFAWLSWHLVEKRFLALKSRFEATR